MKSILVVSEKEKVFEEVKASSGNEFKVTISPDVDMALNKLQKRRFDFVFIDVGILKESTQGHEYNKAMRPFKQLFPTIEIIIMASQEMVEEAVKAVKDGASNYIIYPIIPEEVKFITDIVHESTIAQSELIYLRDQFWQPDSFALIQTKDPQMSAVYDKIKSVAPTKSTVLLTGETGTGKGVLARLIHQHSNRGDAQFISVHCGAIPDTLLESEFFGHEKGAFTGAVKRKLGKFEIANGGTIFLDEIGTISPSAQIKLLEVLQDGTFQRIGGEEILRTDVRIISATNIDLKEMCEEGKFRRDLYYRLNVFPIEIPPLRKRAIDIPHFVEVFLRKLNNLNSKNIQHIDPLVLESFQRYSWPGNIRELENLMERAYILETSPILNPESFPSELFEARESVAILSIDSSLSLAEVRRREIENVERNYLKSLLENNNGKINKSAETAGITPRQLHKLMTKHGLRKEEYKKN